MKLIPDELLIKIATEAHAKALPHTVRKLRPTSYLSIAEAIQDKLIEINQNEYIETDAEKTKRIQGKQNPGRSASDST